MQCPKCGQTIVNNSEYCINCGKTFTKSNQFSLSYRTLIIFFVLAIIIGVLIVLGIMYYGTDKELDNILNDSSNNNNLNPDDDNDNHAEYQEGNLDLIKKYYGHYIIYNVITSTQSPNEIKNNKNDFLGWPIDFFSDKIKISLYKLDWIILNDINMYIKEKDIKLYNKFNELSNVKADFSIEEKANQQVKDTHTYRFIINDNTLYLYNNHTLFELKKVSIPYKNNNNFYKIFLPNEVFSNEAINKFLLSFENEFIKAIEASTNYVIHYYYEKILDKNIMYLMLTKKISEPLGHTFINYESIGYDIRTNEPINLIDYIYMHHLSLSDIEEKYEIEFQKSFFDINFQPLSTETTYYTLNNKLYILIEGQELIIDL